MTRSKKMIGIDFGTTRSCVAVFQHGRIEIIKNNGSDTTPSVVEFFTENGRLVGDEASFQRSVNYKNTVHGVKRLIGRTLKDPALKSDSKHWPFTVVKTDDAHRTKIQVDYKNETKTFIPEEICSMILLKMKNLAEIYLDEAIDSAVITVPASFSYFQRLAIQNAGTIAGLRVIHLINEHLAAALAYFYSNKVISNCNF